MDSFPSVFIFGKRLGGGEGCILPHFTHCLQSRFGRSEAKAAKWDDFNYSHILITSFSTVFDII